MLFRGRTTQPEHLDEGKRTAAEFQAAYAELARVNRLFRLDDPYTRLLSRWLGEERCKKVSFLDLGAGDGWLGQAMEQWAAKRGWEWNVTNLDLNPIPLALRSGIGRVAGSVLALPFADNSFDVVIASQMTHHLNADEDVIRHFREALRVGREGIFITDMQRSAFLYAILKLVLPLLRMSKEMRADGFLSVRKSWRTNEFRDLARRANLPSIEVTNYYGTRLILTARKSVSIDCAIETNAAYRAVDGFYSAPYGK